MPTGEGLKQGYTRDQKLSIVVIVIAALTLALGLLAYLRPSDVAHPPHFDFLTRTVSLPMWMVAMGVVGLIGVTFGLVLLKRQTTKVVLVPPTNPVPATPRALQPQGQPEARAGALPEATTISADRAELTIESPDDVLIRIRGYDASNIKGLVINVDNNRLDAITRVAFTIYTAQSFDARHNDYRSGIAFNAAVISQPESIMPSFSSNPTLFIRKDANTPHLLASNDSSHPMIWPDNDPSEVEKWKLSVGFMAQTFAPVVSNSVPLQAVRTDIVVTWDRPANEFYIDRA